MRNVPEQADRWRQAAEALGLSLPVDRIDRIAPVLSELDRRIRASLDRDLSLIEPAHEFRPDGK